MAKKKEITSKAVNGVSSNVAAVPAAPKEKKARTPKPQNVAKTVEAAPTTPTYENMQEEIARLAYMFWQQRGAVHDDPMQDWLKAETVVLQNGH